MKVSDLKFSPEELEAAGGSKRKAKAQKKLDDLRLKYQTIQKEQRFKKISQSSFLTPEAASYLNEQIKSQKGDKID